MTINIKDSGALPVFINQLVGSGFLNGVVNLSFGTALFSTKEDGSIDPALVITASLRMDLFAAQQLRDRLDQIIEANTKPSGAKEH